MKQEHGVAPTLLADEHLAIGALIAIGFEARAPAMATPVQTGHELGERAFFYKELTLAVKASESGQLASFGVLGST